MRALLIAPLLMCGSAALAATPRSEASASSAPAVTAVLDYVHAQNSTGLLIVQNDKVLVEKNWPAPAADPLYPLFVYGRSSDGALLEDVASQQKSFVAILMAVAIDKGLLDVGKRVSDYIGPGWSRATPEQEAKIRVIDVLTMSSGLNDKFDYVAEPGSVFFYNTPVYSVTKKIVAAAARQPLEKITQDWLTGPVGMPDTAWRKRPAALASVGNDTGLVTTPRDTAAFGSMVLHGGLAGDGKRVVSAASLRTLFTPSATNPAYGRLWWLNGGAWLVRASGAGRKDGPLVTAAPPDMVAAFGAFDRRLYIVPSRKLVVVRTGASAVDKDFDEQLWQRLNKVID